MGELAVLAIGVAIISLLGIGFLCFSKNQKAKNIGGYIFGVWGLLLAYIGATSNPVNYVAEQVICWAGGLIAVIGILLIATKKSFTAAKILIIISIIWGFFNAFIL